MERIICSDYISILLFLLVPASKCLASLLVSENLILCRWSVSTGQDGPASERVYREEETTGGCFHYLAVLTCKALEAVGSVFTQQESKIFIGCIPFVYDESLKQGFSDCIFPRDLTELALLLNNSIKE